MKRLIVVLLLASMTSAQQDVITARNRTLATPSGPVQTPTFCQHNFDGTAPFVCPSGGVASYSATSGNTLIPICANYSNNVITGTTIVDSQGNTLNSLGTTQRDTGIAANSESWEWKTAATATGNYTFTCTYAGTGNYFQSLIEYTPLSTVDRSYYSTGNNTLGAGVTCTFTTTQPDIILVYAFAPIGDAGIHISSPAGFTTETSTFGNMFLFDKGNVPAGAQSITVIGTGGNTNPLHVGCIAMHN